jgi:hypothetical protein
MQNIEIDDHTASQKVAKILQDVVTKSFMLDQMEEETKFEDVAADCQSDFAAKKTSEFMMADIEHSNAHDISACGAHSNEKIGSRAIGDKVTSRNGVIQDPFPDGQFKMKWTQDCAKYFSYGDKRRETLHAHCRVTNEALLQSLRPDKCKTRFKARFMMLDANIRVFHSLKAMILANADEGTKDMASLKILSPQADTIDFEGNTLHWRQLFDVKGDFKAPQQGWDCNVCEKHMKETNVYLYHACDKKKHMCYDVCAKCAWKMRADPTSEDWVALAGGHYVIQYQY